MNGFLSIYKPSGMSSAHALGLIKKRFRGEKMGHMGTLDPLASGVLPIAFGKSTRLFDYLLDKTKVYVAEFTFGYETDTLDRGGEIIAKSDKIPTLSEIESALPSMIGEVEQIPPAYSAKNVNGMRSYELARQGIKVELKPKKVFIKQIEVIGQISSNSFKVKIECKGGTYIRSICRDLAYKLNSFATMTALERLQSGIFNKENSYSLDEIIGSVDADSMLVKPDEVVNFKQLYLSNENTEDVINGRGFYIENKDGLYRVYGKNEFIGIGKVEANSLKIKAFIKD